MPGQTLTELTKVRHPNEKYTLLVTAWSKGGKHLTYTGIVNIRHLEIMPEMRTEGPKQSILSTIDCGVLPQVLCSISTDVWAEEAATSFGNPSAWYWPWTTVLCSLSSQALPLVPAFISAFSDCSLLLQLTQHSIFILIEVPSYVRYRMFKTLSHFNTQINCPPGVNEQTKTWGEGRRGWLRKGRGNQSLDLAGLSKTLRNLPTEESLSFSNNKESACMPTHFIKNGLFVCF